MITWLLIGVVAAMYCLWDFFIRPSKRTNTNAITYGDYFLINAVIVLLGPLSVLYIIGFEIAHSKTITNWWNTKI